MEEIKKYSEYIKGTSTAEKLMGGSNIILIHLFMCGDGTDSASFLIWAVMSI
jgi:hypothetical protein